MGDAVNLGSRLEGITKQYGVGILVTQATVEADPLHAFMKIDEVRVKARHCRWRFTSRSAQRRFA